MDIDRLARAMALLRGVYSEITASQICIFCAVAGAGSDGLPMNRLEGLLGMGSSSRTRNVAALLKAHNRGKMGADLIQATEWMMDRKQKILTLTRRGVTTARQLGEI